MIIHLIYLFYFNDVTGVANRRQKGDRVMEIVHSTSPRHVGLGNQRVCRKFWGMRINSMMDRQ